MKANLKKKKSKLTAKTIKMLFAGVLLLVGLVSSIILSKRQQDVTSRANVDTSVTLSASAAQVNVGDTFQVYADISSQSDLVQSVDLVLSLSSSSANFMSAEPGDFFAAADEVKEEFADANGDSINDIIYVIFLPIGSDNLPPCPTTITDPSVCVASHGSRLVTFNFTATSAGVIDFGEIKVSAGASGQTVDVVSNFTGTSITVNGDEPTATPTSDPTATPTGDPTATPTGDPTATPTGDPTATPTPANCDQLTADFNDDCKVGSYDYQYMKDRYMRADGDALNADIGGPSASSTPDGRVDIWDYSILSGQWTGD